MIKRDFSQFFNYMNANAQKEAKGYKENIFTPPMIHGTCEVKLRFLPSRMSDESDLPGFIESRIHTFQDKDGAFRAVPCLKGVQRRCPICEWNHAIFNVYSGSEAKSHLLGKSKSYYYANVYIISNPNALDTEGKVFKLKFGSEIMKKIKSLTDMEAPFWDYENGRDFYYRARSSAYGVSTAESTFESRVSPISDKYGRALSDEEVTVIDNQLFSLRSCVSDLSNTYYNDVIDRYSRLSNSRLWGASRLVNSPEPGVQYQVKYPFGVKELNVDMENINSETFTPTATEADLKPKSSPEGNASEIFSAPPRKPTTSNEEEEAFFDSLYS